MSVETTYASSIHLPNRNEGNLGDPLQAERDFLNALGRPATLPPPDHPHYAVDYAYLKNRYRDGAQLADYLLRDYPAFKGGCILDVGVGSGGVAIAFARRGCATHGVDISEEYLRIAGMRGKAHGVALALTKWDGRRLPYPENCFSGVLCTDVLEHVPSPAQLAQEIARVLRPGGICYFSTENKKSPVFLVADPHYGLPLMTLLPRRLREFFVVRMTKRATSLDDYRWFGSVREIEGLFRRWGCRVDAYCEPKKPHYEALASRGALFRFLCAIPGMRAMYMNIILTGVAVKVRGRPVPVTGLL
jgi:SAM-dependent methyltransferase